MTARRRTAGKPAEPTGRDAVSDGPPSSRPPASGVDADDVLEPIAPAGRGGRRSRGPQPVSAQQRREFAQLSARPCFTDSERERWRGWLDTKATSYTCWQMIQWLKREKNRRTPFDADEFGKPVAA